MCRTLPELVVTVPLPRRCSSVRSSLIHCQPPRRWRRGRGIRRAVWPRPPPPLGHPSANVVAAAASRAQQQTNEDEKDGTAKTIAEPRPNRCPSPPPLPPLSAVMRSFISPPLKGKQPKEYDTLKRDGRSRKFTIVRLTTVAFIVQQFLLFSPLAILCSSHQCATCGTFSEVKKIRQEQILKDLLKKLDLSAKPNVTVDLTKLPPITHPDPRVQELFDRTLHATHRRVRKSAQLRKRMGFSVVAEEEEQPEYFPALYETEKEPTLQTNYIIAEELPDWFGQIGALFKFSTTLRKSIVQSAKLNVPIRRPIDQLRYTTTPIRLNVFRRYSNGTLSTVLVSKYIELETSLLPTTARVEVPIIEDIVQQWVETRNDFGTAIGEDEGEEGEEEGVRRRGMIGDPYRRHRKANIIALYVEALYDDENLVIHSPEEGDDGEKAMFLELQTYPLKSGRSRRHVQMCRPGQNTTQKCCLYDLMIDFESIGWNFVIAPKLYNAYICSGGCNGLGMGVNSVSMTRQHAASAAKIDHYQCCHPKEYAGIMILFVKENNEVLAREVPNMVAKECGCA
ncbi:hypothetical protein niasHS_017020 [Heterodera schachtii]|uniref:TGF-beta family profile domain-containing protein n=1 Tax=Heterodera schachtii TaxID=97005 RepID=A0ABD2HZE2_HETSC